MPVRIPTIDDVRAAEQVIRAHVVPAPLIRSYALERELGLPANRWVWLKDFGWTPSGSFKVLGALNWMANNQERINDRPVMAFSSGNFASGIAFAGMRFAKRVIVIMPDSAPRVKFERTQSFGAEVRTFNVARDRETGERKRMMEELADRDGAIEASAYDDPHVIAGNGVGALEIVRDLQREGRSASHFLCAVSGGGQMSGQALAISDGFPQARIIGVEPAGADRLCQSIATGTRFYIERPTSICDGLLTHDVGEHNWPILKRLLNQSVSMPDAATQAAMRWLYERHGLRTEPSGAISVAALLSRQMDLSGEGDLVAVISGRNVDEDAFRAWISPPPVE